MQSHAISLDWTRKSAQSDSIESRGEINGRLEIAPC